MAEKKVKKIAFAGGGSGGHIYPQIAVAAELSKTLPKPEIFFVSTKGSIEEKIIPKYHYPLYLIPSGKLKGQNPLSLIKTFATLFISIFSCLKILLRERPDLIFSAGGYAGAPFLVMGALLGIRCEILEQNRHPGLANKWMSKFCKKVYVNFAASAQEFADKETEVVGHPCRAEIEKAKWSASEAAEKWKADPLRIFVFGGSQGAMGINRLVTAAAVYLNETNYEILHQTGEADFERVKREYAESNFHKARVEKYVYEMDKAFNEAHLVICRAGASSLAELAAAGKAALLIPLVSKDRHQEFNAQEMQKLGASACYLQPELNGEKLAHIIKEFYSHRDKLSSLSQKMAELHHPDAASRIAKSVLRSLS